MNARTTAPFRARPAVMIFGALALAGCATFAGTVDDQGRAYRETTEAEVDANLEPLAAEASIQLLNERLPERGGRSRSGAGEPASACEAEQWQRLLGQEGDAIETGALPDEYRIIPFGAMITQEYLPERLNIYLDQDGRVYRVICG